MLRWCFLRIHAIHQKGSIVCNYIVPWSHVGILWQNYRHKLYPFVFLSIGKVHKLTENAILWQFPNDLLLLLNVRFYLASIPIMISGGCFLTQKILDAQNFNAGVLTLDPIWRRGNMGDILRRRTLTQESLNYADDGTIIGSFHIHV